MFLMAIPSASDVGAFNPVPYPKHAMTDELCGADMYTLVGLQPPAVLATATTTTTPTTPTLPFEEYYCIGGVVHSSHCWGGPLPKSLVQYVEKIKGSFTAMPYPVTVCCDKRGPDFKGLITLVGECPVREPSMTWWVILRIRVA